MLFALPLGLSLTINITAGICLVITLIFTIILIQRYQKKHSLAVRHLMIGFLFFIAAGLTAIPIAFTEDDIIKKWAYMAAKILLTFASLYFIKFIISIFAPEHEKSVLVLRLQLIFVIINLVMVVVYHVLEIYLLMTVGISHDKSALWLLPVQGFVTAAPFVWLGYLAFKVAKRDTVLKERRAIQFIALSGFTIALFFIFNGINDALGVSNPWTLPAWICANIAVLCFYIGLVRPPFIFKRYG